MDKAGAGLIGIVGEESKQDFWGTMEKVAAIGYQGIEGGHQLLHGDVRENLRRFHDIGLRVLTTSASRERLRDDLDQVIADARALESPRVSVWWGPCDSKEQLLEDAALYNVAGKRLAAEGIKLCYHNHEHEFRTAFNGVYALDILAEYTDPAAVYFELDIAWIAFGGADPAATLRRYAGRVPAVHVKDLYSLTERGQFTAVGTGVVPVQAGARAAIEAGAEWLVVEQDKLRNLDGLQTATISYLYLKEAGLV